MADIDQNSRTWRVISDWAEEQLKNYRSSLEVPGSDMALTESDRGSILVLKDLLSLPTGSDFEPAADRADNYGMGVRV